MESRKCVLCKVDIIVPTLQTKYCKPCAKAENRIRSDKHKMNKRLVGLING